jgi:hypothetical protein
MSGLRERALASPAVQPHHGSMQLGFDVEGDADAIYKIAGCDTEQPPSIGRLCLALTGFAPKVVDMHNEGRCCRVGEHWRVFVRRGMTPERSVFIAGHELAEWWYLSIGHRDDDIEQRCDALGAALVAPRRAFKRALRAVGHSVTQLATAFQAPQQMALLRIGEVTGRPVVLVRPAPLVRGNPFEWPRGRALTKAVLCPPASAHPVRAGHEWGMMATREAWAMTG